MLSSALRIGQSATASVPSFIASVSRNGDATLPVSRWSRPITIGADSSPLATRSLSATPNLRALALAEPADARRQSLEVDALARERDPAAQMRVVGKELEHQLVGARDVRRDRRRARPSGTVPSPRRTAAGCTRGRIPGISNASRDAGVERDGADVVAVVERDRAALAAARASRARGAPPSPCSRATYAGRVARRAARPPRRATCRRGRSRSACRARSSDR